MGAQLRRPQVAMAGVVAAFLAVGLAGPLAPLRQAVVVLGLGAASIAAAGYVVWRVHPAWTVSVALALSVMAGNWDRVGIPGELAPDRLLLTLAVAAIVLRAPPVRDRPPLRFGAAHWAMVVLLLWAVGSALAVDTLEIRGELFKILERLGVLPFLLFLVAPVAFATEHHRRILLGTLVLLGGYLGITAVLETVGLDALVFPSYIADPSAGIHYGRARGPFVEAVTNGSGLYAGIVGAGIGLTVWRQPLRQFGLLMVIALCSGGVLFTETRSVWLGATAATLITLLFVRDIRRWLIPTLAAGATILALSFALIPGVQRAVTERTDDQATVYDRQNLARAALNIVEEQPLLGVGWGRFTTDSREYFEESPNYPLSANRQIIHNVFLTYAAEIGLIGLALWALVLLLGVGGALVRRVPPELLPWQVALGAYAIFFLAISNFVFAQVFPNNMLWLLAGVALAGGAASTASTPVGEPAAARGSGTR